MPSYSELDERILHVDIVDCNVMSYLHGNTYLFTGLVSKKWNLKYHCKKKTTELDVHPWTSICQYEELMTAKEKPNWMLCKKADDLGRTDIMIFCAVRSWDPVEWKPMYWAREHTAQNPERVEQYLSDKGFTFPEVDACGADEALYGKRHCKPLLSIIKKHGKNHILGVLKDGC